MASAAKLGCRCSSTSKFPPQPPKVRFPEPTRNRNLGMKYAVVHVDRLNLVILADPGCALLTQARPDTIDVGQDQPVMPAAANEGVEKNGLGKR